MFFLCKKIFNSAGAVFLHLFAGYLWCILLIQVSADGAPFLKQSSEFQNAKIPNSNLEIMNSRYNATNSKGGRSRLDGSSSSPVEPIKPLLKLGTKGHSDERGLSLPPHPVFDEGTPNNVSALKDNSAYLHCLVHSLGNKSVSWIRQRDLHILTVDRYTYTTDQRYEVIHSEGSQDWILKIKYAQPRDTGRYECQISTKPVLSFAVYLNVFAPKAAIIGAPDMHVDVGSTINLTCTIEHSHQTPAYIFWYHNGQVVNYDSPRGGIVVMTERNNETTGYLLIQDAKSTDSGNYTCKPSNAASTSLRVHVLHGELPAAMQTSGGEVRPHNFVHFLCLFLVVYTCLMRIEDTSLPS